MPLLLWVIVCAALGGIASAAFAVAFLWVPEAHSARILPHFVSFATGALLGAALLAGVATGIFSDMPDAVSRTVQVAVEMSARQMCLASPAVLFEKLGLPQP